MREIAEGRVFLEPPVVLDSFSAATASLYTANAVSEPVDPTPEATATVTEAS
jgi:hypothetical protein